MADEEAKQESIESNQFKIV